MTKEWKDRPELTQSILAMQAIKRPGRPEEIGETVCFMCSDKASFMTGSVVLVDGGLTA